MKTKVSAIIVTYNNAKTIEFCLSSLQKQSGNFELEIIVVDNNSNNETIYKIEKFKISHLIRNQENLGFGKAINLGVKIASGEYLLLLNPDAELKEEALAKLLEKIKSDEKIAMVGGKFISRIGEAMVSFGNFPNFWTEFFQKTRLAKLFPIGRYICPTIFSKKLFNTFHQVDWVSGGFCLIRKDIFERISGFDEKYFLYLEDIDLAKKVKEQGYKIVFTPNALAIHHQERSGSASARIYEKESLRYYWNKNLKK